MRLRVHGHELYFETHGRGEGPWLVLLHHGLGAVSAWGGQIPALTEAGFRVLAYDRWGYGRSEERPGFPATYLGEEPGDLLALMDELGLERPHLLGHSDGGTIALLFAALVPERVQRLIVVAAHIYNEPAGREGLEATRQRYRSDPAYRQFFQAMHGERSDRLVLSWLDHWLAPESAALEMRAVLPQIHAAALVIQGEQDEFATPQHARDIAEGIRGARLWLIPGVRHNPQLEHRADFNARVIEFLSMTEA